MPSRHLLAVAGLVLCGVALAGASEPRDGGVQVMEYPITPADLEALRADFRDDGRFTLPSPDGPLVIAGVQDCLYEDCVGGWSEGMPDGTWAYHPSPSVFLDGQVVGEPDSMASLGLGEFGVYGTVERPGPDGTDRLYEYDPREGPWGQFTQVVKLERR